MGFKILKTKFQLWLFYEKPQIDHQRNVSNGMHWLIRYIVSTTFGWEYLIGNLKKIHLLMINILAWHLTEIRLKRCANLFWKLIVDALVKVHYCKLRRLISSQHFFRNRSKRLANQLHSEFLSQRSSECHSETNISLTVNQYIPSKLVAVGITCVFAWTRAFPCKNSIGCIT